MSGTPARKLFTIAVVIAVIAILVPFSVSCSKPPAPTAEFTVTYVSGEILILDPIAGLAPLTVRFSDQSSGKISSWRWNLGDGIVVKGSGEEERNFVHTYETTNSSGFPVSLTVTGPGGKDQEVKGGLVAVFTCSEAANVELNQARKAIVDCMGPAKTRLDKSVAGWDGSRGMVTAGGRDAADYLGIWKKENFKAKYDVGQDGTIASGTDVSWGCVYWDSTKVPQARWVGT